MFGGRITDVAGLEGYSELPGLDGLADMKSSDIEKELKRREATKQALSTAAVTYGVDIEELKGLTDPGEILSKASGLKKAEGVAERTRQEGRADAKEERARIEAEKIRNHTITESNNARAHEAAETSKLRAFETQQTNARLAHESTQNNLTRQYQADLAKHDANTKLQLGMMESADRRADRAAAREDRLASQRQASIMALVKGLTQMGAGFAI